MTATADAKQAEKDAKAEALKARSAEMEAEEKKLNEGKTGKGTRVFLGMTRGRNPVKIQYEAFDESLPDTCPSTTSEFLDLTKIQDDKILVGYLISGYNDAAYTQASDPVAEYIDASWDEDVKKGFRLVVRNYAANVGVSIEDAANLIKPAYLKSQEKK